MSRHLTIAAVMLAVLACGNQPGPSAGPTATPAAAQPTAPAKSSGKELLFAVLEPGGDPTSMKDTTVAIVRTNGIARARARFDARQLPKVGNALPLPQPEARAADGKVYYVDGSGVVRSLAVDGTIANVTSFPLTNPQQLLSFTVSPDGSQVLGTLFSFPPVASPPPKTPIDKPFGPGDFTLQVFSARPGQSPVTLAKQNWAQSVGQPSTVLTVVGWSDAAPLATTDTALGTQQGSLGRQMFGHVAELDTAGRPGPPLGGYSCNPWSVLADETVLCDDDGQLSNFSVRSKDGVVRYHLHAPADAQYLDLNLAPDGSRVAYLIVNGESAVTDSAGRTVNLASGFRPEGWLDNSTVIGVLRTAQGDGDMALVSLSRPTRLTDLGFKGFFAGVVQG